ncbi:MAG TPA: ribbon-helix-helix domain-containing protein [Geminicoccaceae bacterium]|nr:ribbon-helix-helix domain-containing protein [Geminicoccaceae bacterium]
MIRKTMRIGEVRTSIKLEPEFWSYLREVAEGRGMRLSGLVNEVARASPERTNLASTLRTFCLIHAQLRCRALQQEVEKLTLAGNTQNLTRVIEACPLPCVILSEERVVRRVNRAFVLWLNLDERGVVGQRLDNIMILRGANMPDMWRRLLGPNHPGGGGTGGGEAAAAGGTQALRGGFNATYVSPGKVRTSQALAVSLASPQGGEGGRSCLVLFETLAGRV